MPITNSVRNKKNTAVPTLSNVRIHRSKTQDTAAPMLTQKVAPAGTYSSRITAVTASKIETTQADSVDVTYELTDAGGKIVLGRLRYEIGGYHFDRLGDALIDAGLPDGSPITEAVGICEELEIVYPQRNSLAKIKSRRPLEAVVAPKKVVAKPAAPTDDFDDDSEFDDFLTDEEDDD